VRSGTISAKIQAHFETVSYDPSDQRFEQKFSDSWPNEIRFGIRKGALLPHWTEWRGKTTVLLGIVSGILRASTGMILYRRRCTAPP
jgi:hypothetical protein